jgi:hypothetical protein
VTLTLIPSPRASVIAGAPSVVAGILMKRFSRSTSVHSSRADARVASVSNARVGATSIETRPSTPPVAANVGWRTSQAAWTSLVVSSKTTFSTSSPSATSARTSSSYRSPSEIADAKIVGFVVTPTTDLCLTRSARLPVSIRSRDRSSSQIETPASESAFSRSLMLPPVVGRSVVSAGGRRDAVVGR